MTKNSKKHWQAQSSLRFGGIFMFVVLMLAFTTEIFAQDYLLSLNPRRLGNQLGVEIWIKALNESATPLGEMTIPVRCNGSFLVGASNGNKNQPSSQTDSVINDVNILSPYITITSACHNNNGYVGLYATATVDNNYSIATLNVRLDNPPGAGFRPSSMGRGSFIGMLRYDIKPVNLGDNDLAGFEVHDDNTLAHFVINSISGANITSTVELEPVEPFTVRGIKILNPNNYQTINRYPSVPYRSMGDNLGYPIYFERSGLAIPNVANGVYGTPRYAYQVSYSLDGGLTYTETGRVAESRLGDKNMTTDILRNANYTGMLDFPNTVTDYYITTGSGKILPNDVPNGASLSDLAEAGGLNTNGYGGVLKIIWKNDQNFPFRSENARIRITQLTTVNVSGNVDNFSVNLNTRDPYSQATRRGSSTASFVLGRIFFAQLDGQCQYFKSARNFIAPAYFTVEAWINLNANNGPGTQPGVVAASSGSAAPGTDGAWILYLDDGIYPAFRLCGRENDTVGIVRSPSPISVHSVTNPDGTILMDGRHSANWTHIAVIVARNVISLYVDGERVDQYINPRTAALAMESAMPIWVGVNPNNQFQPEVDFLNAGIKEVKVWRYELSQAELKQYISGVPFPTMSTFNPSLTLDAALKADASTSKDPKNFLYAYYNLQGIYADIADQGSQDYNNDLQYYVQCDNSTGAVANNLAIIYRPDGAHIKLTSPSCGEGVSNIKGKTYEIRWASYGIGNSLPSASGEVGDVTIQVSRDGGGNWFDAIGQNRYDSATGGTFAISLDNEEIELGYAVWEPYNNVTLAGIANDLQGVYPVNDNYVKKVRLRISGTEGRMQSDIFAESGDFIVAPHFALVNKPTTKITIQEGQKLNVTTTNMFIEAWISPYTFPFAGDAPYPIIVKKDPNAATDEDGLHYALRLLPTGQLSFSFASYDSASNTRDIRTVNSDPNRRFTILNPNAVQYDSIWYHVGVLINLPQNGTTSNITFYIDGVAQRVDSIVTGLGSGIVSETKNNFPTYIGYEPLGGGTDSTYFDGAIKEVRFWRNTPAGIRAADGVNGLNDQSISLTRLQAFIQGASTVRASELIQVGSTNYAQNLIAAYSMDGGSWVNMGADNTIAPYPLNNSNRDLLAKVFAGCGDRQYAATYPYLKLVEPISDAKYANNDIVRVRWVGFDYNRNDLETFTAGIGPKTASTSKPADLSLSDGSGGIGQGSGNLEVYVPVAGVYDNTAYANSMQLNKQLEAYEFLGAKSKSQFAADVNLGIANPNAETVSGARGQGTVPATQKTGRFRLFGRANINSPKPLEYEANGVDSKDGLIVGLKSEGPSFNITPQSNFTVRVLLEGYHQGNVAGITGSLPPNANDDEATFRANGLRIRFYDETYTPIANGVTTNRADYTTTAKNVANRQKGTNDFANVKFTLTEMNELPYYVVIEHQNYLPIMTAYTTPFIFTGESKLNSWEIESGWDFTSWNGTDGNYLVQQEPMVFGNAYSAYAEDGAYSADRTGELGGDYTVFNLTGLNFNNGYGSKYRNNGLPAMVGGDITRDGMIDAKDRTELTLGAMSNDPKYNLKSSSGASNGVDRTILDNNLNKVASIMKIESIRNDLYGSNNPGIIAESSAKSETSSNYSDNYTKFGVENSLNSLNNTTTNGTISNDVFAGGSKEVTVNHNYNSKNSNGFQADNIDYKVTAEIKKIAGTAFVDVDMYIQNIGSDWNMANASFPIIYDESVLGFADLVRNNANGTPTFETKDRGYSSMYYAPTSQTSRPISSTYSIEINFDAETIPILNENGVPVEVPKNPGTLVPRAQRAYIGSLRFYLRDENADITIIWDTLSAAVLSIEGKDLTRYGSFEAIKPILIDRKTSIVSPRTGDKYIAGLTNKIIWGSEVENALVDIQYKIDGSAWNTINTSPVSITTFEYVWRTPIVNSSNCYVRIVNASNGKELALSGVFSIEKVPTEITRPAEHNTLYTAGASDYIEWNTGEDVLVNFEFSENGISNWTKVAGPVSSTDRKVAWVVKSVTSCQAVIRMVNAQTGDVMAVSTPFRIGSGTVALSSPEKGRTYKTGSKLQIKWSSKGVTSFDLEYSTNAGNTWTTIANVKASDKTYTWTIPDVITTNAIVRAISSSNSCLEYTRSGAFSVNANQGNNSVDDTPQVAGNAIVSVSPNPVTNDAIVRINLVKESTVNGAVYDVRGLRVLDFAEGILLPEGFSDLVFDAANLSSGVYIIRLQIAGTIITKEFVKIK